MNKLKNSVVFVTGANRGIGKALVEAALKMGAAKIYAASRNPEKRAVFNDQRVIHLTLDITKPEQIEQAVNQATDTNILINNAGVLSNGNVLTGSTEAMQFDLDINYFATIKMMQAFAPILEKNVPSRMVNIVSIVALAPLPAIAGYAASKAALLSATQSVRIELAKKNITVHAVNPGAIDTDMNKGSDWDMPAPEGIALNILSAVEAGQLDIVPDQMGRDMHTAWRESPTKLERIFHDMHHQE